MTNDGFTNKEMLVRILDKLDRFENKFEKVDKQISETKELASKTNGKVKLHTKMISALVGSIVTLAGWMLYYFSIK